MEDRDIADYLDNLSFPCACGKTLVHFTNLEMGDAIEWLRDKVPIYHWGFVGCCEKLRCYHCEEMPAGCECDEYLDWDEGVEQFGEKEDW